MLRPYQEALVTQVRSMMQRGVRSILVQSPTGSGKTLLTAHMVKTAASKGMSCLFTVHRRELVKQSVLAFSKIGINLGVVAAGFMEDRRHLVQIGSIQTVAKRWHRMKTPKLIVIDECHHVAAASWSAFLKNYPDAFVIGLTATPQRLDGTGLNEWFKEMVNGPSVRWLIDNKFLSDYKLYVPSSPDLAGVHTRMGDYVKSELNLAVDKPTITGDAIKHYVKYASGKRAVVFCVSVQHSQHVVSQFNAAGIPAEHVDGETPTEERDAAIKRFSNGETLILSNVELFGEGFDLPAMEVAILLRPTQSLGLYLQQVGRVLRPCEGKSHAIILDHAGNCLKHGLPDDEREWILDGRNGKKRSKDDACSVSVRVCPVCFAAQFIGKPVCGYCGHIFELKPRKVDHVEGELVEADVNAIRLQRKKEQGKTQTYGDLVALGKSRGYKKPEAWAALILKARQAKRIGVLR